MLRRHIILLIAIRPSDGDVKTGGPFGAFRDEQAMSRHLVSPSSFHSSSSSPTTQLHYTNSYTYSHPNPSAVCMLRRHTVLLIVIRPSDGDVTPGGPLGAFREEQAMSWHRVSPSLFLPSSSRSTQLQYTNSFTYSHPNLDFLQYTIQIIVPHVM